MDKKNGSVTYWNLEKFKLRLEEMREIAGNPATAPLQVLPHYRPTSGITSLLLCFKY